MANMKHCRVGAFLLVAGCNLVAHGGAPAPPALEDLAWMAGHWAATVGDVQMEEAWTGPEGGVMLGVHRDVPAGGAAFFEYLRIEERDGEIVYIASPMGRGATEFALALIEGRRAIFENLEHDFPQRIIYHRDGDRLSASAEGVVDGESRSEKWEWQLLP
jgi:hypothetical protein